MSRKKINPDSFDREAIRRTIHAFYERNEYPTLDSVLEQESRRRKYSGVEGVFFTSSFVRWASSVASMKISDIYIYEQPHTIQQRYSYLYLGYLRKLIETRNIHDPQYFLKKRGAMLIMVTPACGLTVMVPVGSNTLQERESVS